MDQQPNVAYLNVDYNQMLSDPLPILDSVNDFCGGTLDVDAMAAVIDPSLYRIGGRDRRQGAGGKRPGRVGGCWPGSWSAIGLISVRRGGCGG